MPPEITPAERKIAAAGGMAVKSVENVRMMLRCKVGAGLRDNLQAVLQGYRDL